jgi:hypothetical protein
MNLVCSECAKLIVPHLTKYVAGYGVLQIAPSSQRPFVPKHGPQRGKAQALVLDTSSGKVTVIDKVCIGSYRQPASTHP